MSDAGPGRTGRFGEVDVLVQGEGIRRGVTVEVTGEVLRAGDLRLPGADVWWTSRRAGLLMIFGRETTVAVKGERAVLDALARRVEGLQGAAGARGRLPDALTGEVVVCTAGTAVVGRFGGRETSGLRVAVFTRRGVHLLAGERDLRLGWPVDEAREVEGGAKEGRGRTLLFRKDEDVLRLLYLFPEEIDAVLRVAREGPGGEPLRDGVRRVEIPAPPPPEEHDEAEGPETPRGDALAAEDEGAEDGAVPGAGPAGDVAPAPPPGDRDAAAEGAAGRPPEGPELEMFDRREVAGPIRPELPEFRLSVDVLREGAEEAAAGLSRRGRERAGLAAHFLETHFLELGETALGPLLLRKSAAATARTLERVVDAMDASELETDTEAAASNAADRMLEVYGSRLEALLAAKRAPAAVEAEHELGVEEREDLRLRIHAPFEKLAPRFRELEERQQELRRRVRILESGPPGGDDRGVREAAEKWRRALARVDRGFVDAWEEVVDEIAGAWERRLLPSLAEVGSMRRRRLPEWARLALLAAATLLGVAAATVFLAR